MFIRTLWKLLFTPVVAGKCVERLAVITGFFVSCIVLVSLKVSRNESASSCECLSTHFSTSTFEFSSPKLKELTLKTIELDRFEDKDDSLDFNLRSSI